MENGLLSFIIGSSLLVIFLFYMRVAKIQDKTYSYVEYTLLAPLYLGVMNYIGFNLQKHLGWSLRKRMLVIGLSSGLFVYLINYFLNTYPKFNKQEWRQYFFQIMVLHFLLFNIIIYYLEKEFAECTGAIDNGL